MATQLRGINVTLPSVGVSLTPTTLQLPWGYKSESLLLGVSIIQTSVPPSTVPFVGSADIVPGTLIWGM